MILTFVIATFILTLIHLLRQEFPMSHYGAQYDDLITAINANTNLVAARMDVLLADVAARAKNGDPMTDAQFAALETLRDHLKALGSDVQLPVPAVPDAPVAVEVAPVVAPKRSVPPAKPATESTSKS